MWLCVRMILLFLFIVHICNSITTNYIQENCRAVNLPTLALWLQEKILDDHVYKNVSTLDRNFCLIRCLRQRKCKSVNYNQDTLICQLNSENHVSQPSSIKVTSDNTQYFTIDDVDEVLLGRCNGHICADDLVCVPLTYGFSDPYRCTSSEDIATTTHIPSCDPADGCTNCMQAKYSLLHFTFRPIGCFHAGSSPNILPTYQKNLRQEIDWNNLQLTVDICATLAFTYGYKYFGIEFWGECWVSSSFDPAYHSLVSASECKSKCVQGVAEANTMFIYVII